MSINTDNWLDVWQVGQELIGDTVLIVVVSVMILNFLMLKADLDFGVIVLLNMLWLAILFNQTFIISIWIFVLLIAGIFFYYNLAQKLNR